ncbi:hypothetical protein GCM10008942_30660 [Rhizomicrobium electricum]|uniref:Uncharacterized protein n=1 Tax=Rhizomicrobium electricum TaxID=480070 RepID=A0ABN1F124_9PROT
MVGGGAEAAATDQFQEQVGAFPVGQTADRAPEHVFTHANTPFATILHTDDSYSAKSTSQSLPGQKNETDDEQTQTGNQGANGRT